MIIWNSDIKDMVGKVFTSVTTDGYDTMTFKNDVESFKFYHSQDCCESVSIETIVGDLSDLVGTPLLMAEEVSNDALQAESEDSYDSCTWTFYKFATIHGYVDVRWFGSSNGYYSESVHLEHETFETLQ
jgi:hypothetical protein